VNATKEETLAIAPPLRRGRRDRDRGAAGRPAEGAGGFTRIPRASPIRPSSSRRWPRRASSRSASAPIPTRTPRRDAQADDRLAQAQDRRGRVLGHHPVLLRGRDLLPLPRRLRRPASTPRSSPASCPIENWAGVRRFAARCGATIPAWLDEAFATAARDGREELLATAVCTELCTAPLEGGVEDLHFYTLNKPHLTRNVVHALGIAPEVTLEKVA
jgi:methylenetetrahydrofolate reductase (NADPH)